MRITTIDLARLDRVRGGEGGAALLGGIQPTPPNTIPPGLGQPMGQSQINDPNRLLSGIGALAAAKRDQQPPSGQ